MDRLMRIFAGVAGAALVLALAAQFAVPLLRYGLGMSFAWLDDLAVFAFAVSVALVFAWTLREGRHAQVDVFSQRWSRPTRVHLSRVGTFLFLLPFCGALLWLSVPYAAASWRILEASGSSGGMGGLFLVKSAVPLAALLLLIAGIAEGLRRDRP